MIRIAFTLANNIAKHFRFSPTAIVEGREQGHLETLMARHEKSQLTRLAEQQALNARLQNITCAFEREREQIIYDFADPQNPLSFTEAWLKLDDVEQRSSDKAWKDFYRAQQK